MLKTYMAEKHNSFNTENLEKGLGRLGGKVAKSWLCLLAVPSDPIQSDSFPCPMAANFSICVHSCNILFKVLNSSKRHECFG